MMVITFLESSRIQDNCPDISISEGKPLEALSKFWLVFPILLFLLFARPIISYSAEAQIRDVLIEKNPRSVVVFAKVANGFTKDMDEAILAGIPMTFTFYVDFYQRRSLWFDKKLSSQVIEHTIKYDPVKKTFFVSSSRGKEPSSHQDFNTAKEVMVDLSGLEIVQVAHLKKNTGYYLEIKAKLKRVTLPLKMEYVFFFVSLWDFETRWFKEEFRY
jgi:hypothetical protein